MRWFRPGPPAEPEPGLLNVRIERRDGTVTQCEWLADPEPEDGMTAYVIIPRDGMLMGPGDVLRADRLPARSALRVDVTLPWPAP